MILNIYDHTRWEAGNDSTFMSGRGMLKKYRSENENFLRAKLIVSDYHQFVPDDHVCARDKKYYETAVYSQKQQNATQREWA